MLQKQFMTSTGNTMSGIGTFLKDLFALLYHTVKTLALASIPKSVFYKELKNEIVLITGGGNGLGRQLAIKLSDLGCKVVVWDIDRAAGEETVKIITDAGGKGYFYRCNVADRRDVYSNAAKVKQEVGLVTLLINNAAVTTNKSIIECPDHLIEKTFAVNIFAHFWTCKAFLPDMMANSHGHIVNIASLAGYSGICNLSSYCASKAAAVNFHESLSMELRKGKFDGIKTTLVCTWHMDTNMFREANIRYAPPPLRASDAANRIVNAIRGNEDIAIIPWYFGLALLLKSILPLSVFYKILEIGGAFNCMDNVSGTTNYDKM